MICGCESFEALRFQSLNVKGFEVQVSGFLGFKVSRNQGFEDFRFRGFWVTIFLGFQVTRFQELEVSG
jgi:hypothetical protein